MIRKIMSLIILMLVLVSGASAQEGDRMANPIRRDYHQITTIELVQEGETTYLVIKGDFPDGCDMPTVVNTERIGATWFVDMYREMPFDVMCPMVLVSYEQKIDASVLFEADENGNTASLIVINGMIYGLDLIPDMPPTLNTLWVRGILPYVNVTTRHTEEGDMEIKILGTLTDGCAVPVYRALEDWQNPGFVTVEAYTVVNIAASCMQVQTPYELVMRSPVFDSLAVNGVSIPFSPEMNVDTQGFFEEQLVVNLAKVEWVEGLLPNVKITVSGIKGGCDAPVQIVPQKTGDNTYVVKVVMVLPVTVDCPMVVRDYTEELMFAPVLVGDFPLQFIINNQTYTP